MLYIETLFDNSPRNPKPLVVGMMNSSSPNDIVTIDLWLPNKEITIDKAELKTQKFLKDVILEADSISINDWKTHINSLNLLPWNYNVFCRPSSNINDKKISPQELVKRRLIDAFKKNQPSEWQKVLAKAHMAYAHMEKTGIRDGIQKLYPVYSTDTFTGRSKTTGFVLQGQNEESIILPHEGHSYFIQFDWTAADTRIASLLSRDQIIESVFQQWGDPYSLMIEKKRSQGLPATRDEVKKEWLRTLYSMDANSAIVSYFPELKRWMLNQIEAIDRFGKLTSILGREFRLEDHPDKDKHGKRAVFNAILQGSVAHAMHATLYKVCERFPKNVFTEIHDSLIMSCSEDEILTITKEVCNIMSRPFSGIINDDPVFPIKVSIGKDWKKWQEIKGIEKCLMNSKKTGGTIFQKKSVTLHST